MASFHKAPVRPLWVTEAVERMRAAAGAGGGSALLLTGPGLRMLLPVDTALEAWLARLKKTASKAQPCCLHGAYALPEANLLVLDCSRKGVDAVADAAQAMVAGGGDGDGDTGGAAPPLLSAAATSLSMKDALTSVMQELWDGKSGLRVAAAAGGGSGGLSGSLGGSAGGEEPTESEAEGSGQAGQGEMRRLRGLLRLLGNLEGLPEWIQL
ncbi:hypothetical protein HYH03_007244 [Edaphochlamys debaryana]|uniref:Uncharacterized protein n=1 Tax=Edaphochlamys debaryana TaxID=47281 RepID=A0A835Y2H4_9CHLO|nr:hypothetical protein HYH03_007244 [Edaphochlamys debaryana]|eukprot:KAG2494730.1 hypothetical protein HYH03_007244 [Edaphochlamys debaryana]